MTIRPDRYVQLASQYEPEGICLTMPLEGTPLLLQAWGENPEFHAHFTYNGVPLKGHPGVDFIAAPESAVLAVDSGRVVEIGNEPGGFGRYIKLEHHWGESFYAHLGEILVESGQSVTRKATLAHTALLRKGAPSHLHLGIRLVPFQRLDGWGGFSNPLPYLYVAETIVPFFDANQATQDDRTIEALPPMLHESTGCRRP